MQIEYLNHLPAEFLDSAIELYFNSLREKLEPILGSDGRAQEALVSSIMKNNGFIALCEGKLVGIMGVQTSKGGFINPSFKTMVRVYGKLGGLVRLWGLWTLHHSTKDDELYVDGVAVAPEMRGNGIGTQLFELMESTASAKGINKITLDVIDTNPKAKALYKQLGFLQTNVKEIWPLNLLIKFPFKSATFMVKTIG